MGAAKVNGTPRCGAKLRRSDARCRRPAGAGTPTPGYGPCSMHLGLTPTVRRRWDREAALAEAARHLGGQLDVSPEQALEAAVGMAAADVAFLRREASRMAEGAPAADVARAYELAAAALDRMVRAAKAAADAGVTDKRAKLAQLQGHAIADALERSLKRAFGERLAEEDHRAVVATFAAELRTLELEVAEDAGLAPPFGRAA